MRTFTWPIVLIIALCGILMSCISTPALPTNKRPLNWAQVIDPATNLYQVDKHLFRSQQPKPSDIAALQRLHINTVINLRHRQTDNDLSTSLPLTLINVPMQTWALSTDEVAQALIEIKNNSQQGSVLVHCQHGADRTGLVIAMYRIIEQHWSIEAARDEMKHGGFGFHPIWVNIDQFFEPEYIAAIQKAMQRQRMRLPQVYQTTYSTPAP